MVGVHVRDQHAQQRQPIQLAVEHLLPAGAGVGVVDAAVHRRPAVAAVDAVAQQPQVDVVQRKRQRHAQPAHAGRHLQRGARRGQLVAQRVAQRIFVGLAHVVPDGV
jgi:hypothetical protein